MHGLVVKALNMYTMPKYFYTYHSAWYTLMAVLILRTDWLTLLLLHIILVYGVMKY